MADTAEWGCIKRYMDNLPIMEIMHIQSELLVEGATIMGHDRRVMIRIRTSFRAMVNYYAVRNGRAPGIYSTWRECKENTNGYSKASFAKFSSLDEANKFMDGAAGEKEGMQRNVHNICLSDGETCAGRTVVYTDGCCKGNGLPEATAGFGAYWPVYPERNISKGVPKVEPQTNQRAELHAVSAALESARDINGDLEIRVDSRYVADGLATWSKKWKEAEWNVNVKNRDLFNHIVRQCEDRKGVVFIRHVPGHEGELGNEEADRLAKLGAGSYSR